MVVTGPGYSLDALRRQKVAALTGALHDPRACARGQPFKHRLAAEHLSVETPGALDVDGPAIFPTKWFVNSPDAMTWLLGA